MDRVSYRKKFVESAQVRTRDLDLRSDSGRGDRFNRPDPPQGQTVGLAADQLGIE
jgi:hypothetical protein